GAPENDAIYLPIAFDDPGIEELARSIKEHGIQEPLLVSSDGYLISGHRRRTAAILLDLKDVPVRVHPVSYAKDHEQFLRLLVECNAQRIKAPSVLVHEEQLKIDPAEALQEIVNDRKDKEERRQNDHVLNE